MNSHYTQLWSSVSSLLARKLPTSTVNSFRNKSLFANAVVLYTRNNVVKIIGSNRSNNRLFCSSSTSETKGTVISPDEVRRFIIDCMVKVGTPTENASQLASVLAEADQRGHYSHGLNRLGEHLSFLHIKMCKSFCKQIHLKIFFAL